MHEKRTKKRNGSALRALLILTLLFVLLAADSALRPVTTQYALSCASLPDAFDGFCILQLSDIHGAAFGRDNVHLLRAAAQTEPDIIALTGDLADRHTDLAATERLLGALSEIAPVFYVSGNHEWSEGLTEPLREIFARTEVTYLRNEYMTFSRGEAEIVIAGVEDPNGYRDMPQPDAVVSALRAEKPDDFLLLLGHRNDWTERYPTLPVDLILCGHAHGGLIRIPGVGGVFGPGRAFFPDFTEGVYSSGTYRMVVSRGLGSSAPIPRLLNNPELVCITLHTE